MTKEQKADRGLKIQSAFLTKDQEVKVNRILNLAKDHAQFVPSFGKTQVPEGYRTLRVLVESEQSRDVLESLVKAMKEGMGLLGEFEEAIKDFDKVMKEEIKQVEEGKQKFVAEKDEK